MNAAIRPGIEAQLANRRALLHTLATNAEDPQDLVLLLNQVDRALQQLATNAYGNCAVCGGAFDDHELVDNPLATYCLCCLTDVQQRLLERDLELAWQIQASLLPPARLSAAGWDSHYRYQPLGAVSGDYCDLLPSGSNGDSSLYFVMGDVSGKGVAAALLMSHLSATVRSLIRTGVDLPELVAETHRTLRRHSPESHYMTLVCGRAHANGRVDLINAGHCPPLVLRKNTSDAVPSSGPPIGLFDLPSGAHPGLDGHAITELELDPGDTLLLYTDGITEAVDRTDQEYGVERLAKLGARMYGADPVTLVSECLRDLSGFLGGGPRTDDVAVMALRRAPAVRD